MIHLVMCVKVRVVGGTEAARTRFQETWRHSYRSFRQGVSLSRISSWCVLVMVCVKVVGYFRSFSRPTLQAAHWEIPEADLAALWENVDTQRSSETSALKGWKLMICPSIHVYMTALTTSLWPPRRHLDISQCTLSSRQNWSFSRIVSFLMEPTINRESN